MENLIAGIMELVGAELEAYSIEETRSGIVTIESNRTTDSTTVHDLCGGMYAVKTYIEEDNSYFLDTAKNIEELRSIFENYFG